MQVVVARYDRASKALAKRYTQLKPTRAKFTTSMELGIVWAPTWFELDRVGFNLIKLKLSPNCSQVFHHLANSSQVLLLLLCDYAVVFRQLNCFLPAGSPWQYRLATGRCKFWFCWLELGVPFGQTYSRSLECAVRIPSWALRTEFLTYWIIVALLQRFLRLQCFVFIVMEFPSYPCQPELLDHQLK